MKIKIFCMKSQVLIESKSLLENDVNDFIKDKDVVDIKFTTDSRDSGDWFNVLIMYTEVSKQ